MKSCNTKIDALKQNAGKIKRITAVKTTLDFLGFLEVTGEYPQ